METLKIIYNELLMSVNTKFVRYLYNQLPWEDPLLLILGARGVGKTTMMLQHIVLQKEQATSLYVTADNPYFSTHTLFDTAKEF